MRPPQPDTSLTARPLEIEPVTLSPAGEPLPLGRRSVEVGVEWLAPGLALELVLIPGGVGLMGSPSYGREPDEQPQHRVTLAPFWLSRGLITQAQWRAVMGRKDPSRFHGADLPVDGMAWEEARRFCERLSRQTRRAYRLPSEAEWEYACRAGTVTEFNTGVTLSPAVANYNGEFVYGAGPRGPYRHTTTPAGAFPPNAFGVYDLHGNLWEWCADGWHADYQGAPSGNAAWPPAPGETGRVLRGGCWHDPPQVCRSAARLRYEAQAGDEFVGLRVAGAF